MLANPVPKPMLRILEVTTRYSGWAVIGGWAYLALALLGVVLAEAYVSLPAARGFLDVWSADGAALIAVTAFLTLAHWLASRLVRAEQARPAT